MINSVVLRRAGDAARCFSMRRRRRRAPAQAVAMSSTMTDPSHFVDTLIVLFRHGERAPMLNCHAHCSPAETAGETNLWAKRMVPDHEAQRLGELYRVKAADPLTTPPDELTAPFGNLTHEGLQHLHSIGSTIRLRYMRDGIDRAQVEARSTNYRRTQLSAQALLDGLRKGRGGIPVIVKTAEDDFLNSFVSRGEEMAALVTHVEQNPTFAKYEEEVGGKLKRELIEAGPPGMADQVSGRFRWMMAADYFLCRLACGIAMTDELRQLAKRTIDHFTWRFRQFYSHPPLLSAMTAPVLSHVLQLLQCATMRRASTSEPALPAIMRRVHAFSCHDVTIAGLNYCFDSQFVQDEGYWPPYGSYISFELVYPRAASLEQMGGASVGPWVRISLDGMPLESKRIPFNHGKLIDFSEFEQAMEPMLMDDLTDLSLSQAPGALFPSYNPGILH
jgi:hypothetical protein